MTTTPSRSDHFDLSDHPGEWWLTAQDLADLSRGATLLGTGGGGDPYIGSLLVEAAIAEHGPVRVLSPTVLDDEMFVIPTAMMGAPTVMVEKIPAGHEPELALATLEEHLGRQAEATMPIECGGINSMIPLLVGARTGLPVVDADGMGRAFPELQMETFAVEGVPGSPLAIGGEGHERLIFDTGADNRRLEWLARGAAIRLGGSALIAEYAMTGEQVKRTAVPHTLSLALAAGRAIAAARESHRDPIVALAEAFAPTIYSHLRVLFRGKVVDVNRRTTEGFTRGSARFVSDDFSSTLEIQFQNESLIAVRDGQVVAIVPDLICVLEAETAEPITTESLRYGQRVTVVGLSTPDIMRTAAALDTFGPAAFGLDYPFIPVEELIAA